MTSSGVADFAIHQLKVTCDFPEGRTRNAGTPPRDEPDATGRSWCASPACGARRRSRDARHGNTPSPNAGGDGLSRCATTGDAPQSATGRPDHPAAALAGHPWHTIRRGALAPVRETTLAASRPSTEESRLASAAARRDVHPSVGGPNEGTGASSCQGRRSSKHDDST